MKITKTKRKTPTVFWIVTIIFSIYAFTLVYPFVWMFLNSFKNNGEYLDDSFALPTVWRFENYFKAFTQLKVTGSKTQLGGMFVNSFILALSGTFLNMLLSAITAYIIAKYKFRGRNLIYDVAIFVMTIPIVGSLGAQYKLVSALNLKNNVIGISVLFASPLGSDFLMLYAAFKSTSWEYAESAMMDGCSKIRIFFQIMLPLVFPLIMALSTTCFIGIWNNYSTPMLYLKKAPTVSYGLQAFETTMQYRGANYPVYFAAVMWALIPVVTIFCLLQRKFMGNMVIGGLKG